MSNPLPILRNTSGTLNAQALYPFVRSVRFVTTVNTFMNGSEQRWPNTGAFYDFSLPMTALNQTDKNNWVSFFAGQRGRFNQNLTITIGATTYSNLTLLSDDLAFTNPSSLLFNQSVDLRQTNSYPYTPTTPGTQFPTFSFGAVAEQPFVQVEGFITSIDDSPYGPRYAYAWYDASLAGFPTSYLQSWKINFGLLSQADMDTLEAFFYSVQGEAVSFSFADPLSGSNIPHVRFDQDSLDIKYLTVNNLSTSVKLVQTYLS